MAGRGSILDFDEGRGNKMHWSSFSEFVSMGGYGFYVWGSYGVTLLLLVAEVLMLMKGKRAIAKK